MFCPHCGNEVADDQAFCHHCGSQLRAEGPVPAAEPTPVGDGRQKTSWEDRETGGFFSGLFRTLSDALFQPSEFYKRMPVTGGLTDPLLYALIVGMVGVIFSYLWQLFSRGAMESILPGMQSHQYLAGTWLALTAFLSPFLLIIGLFISSGILHLCLLMVKGTKHGFEATFRVVAYGYSTNVFFVIPFCGGFVWLVWTIVLYITGLREAHETTGGKAAFAVFLPAIVCCGSILFLSIFMGLAAVSLGSLMQMQR